MQIRASISDLIMKLEIFGIADRFSFEYSGEELNITLDCTEFSEEDRKKHTLMTTTEMKYWSIQNFGHAFMDKFHVSFPELPI